jgi:rod shape-determining protein MreC
MTPSLTRRSVIPALLLASLGFTWVHNRAMTEGYSSPVASVALSILAPGQKVVTGVVGAVSSVTSGFGDSKHLTAENVRLRRSEDMVNTLEIRLRELERENIRLKALLGYRQQHPRVMAARVVAENGSPWSRTAIIDRGEKDGINVKDVAVTERGLVGQVWSVSSSKSALVLLLTDSNSGVGALVERSRVVGILKGRGGDLPLLAHLKDDADVKEGDIVVTSGRGGVFPKGIPIGAVMKVQRDRSGAGRTAEVKPFANLDQLEELLLLRGGEELAKRPGL